MQLPTEGDVRGYAYGPLKTEDFTAPSKHQVFHSKNLVFQIFDLKY